MEIETGDPVACSGNWRPEARLIDLQTGDRQASGGKLNDTHDLPHKLQLLK
jgi:hypothetical protein